MGDAQTDETVQGKMVQTDTEIKRNSVISDRPKPPLPKKPPVAIKPKIFSKGDSQDKDSVITPKVPPPLPKTPPRGQGGTSVQNALENRSTASTEKSFDIPSTNHIADLSTASVSSSNHLTGASNTKLPLTFHVTDTSNITLSCQIDKEGSELVTTTNNGQDTYQTQSRTFERSTSEQGDSHTVSVEHCHTLPKVPPKVSPKPSKKPPNVLPKPQICKKSSNSDLQSDTFMTKEAEKLTINNNIMDSSYSSSTNSEENTCDCGKSSTGLKMTSGEATKQPVDNRIKNTLNSELQNGHSRPPPLEIRETVCDSVEKVKEMNPVEIVVHRAENLTIVPKKNVDKNIDMCDSIGTSKEVHGAIDNTCTSFKSSKFVGNNSTCNNVYSSKQETNHLRENEEQHSELKLTEILVTTSSDKSDILVDRSDKDKLDILDKFCGSEDNLAITIGDIKDSKESVQPTLQENVTLRKTIKQSVESQEQFNPSRRLSAPSPAPRKTSPKPRPTPRKRLSLSKSCDQSDVISDNTHCLSAKTHVHKTVDTNIDHAVSVKPSLDVIPDSSRTEGSPEPLARQKLDDSLNLNLKSNSVSPSDDHSFCNVSNIENDLPVENVNRSQLINKKLSASHNLLQTDDGSLQRKMDFSPMTEEALGETSSLLDEIEQIVSRRINALGGLSSEFSLKKAHSIDTSTPVRPPRRKHKNRKSGLDLFHDLNGSDTDSLQGDASFKGSASSLNMLDDGDQSFKGSNSSLASNQSESTSRKPCPPKPPRKKLLKLNRSQSDVSASKFLERNKENCNKKDTKNEKENYKKNVQGDSPSLLAKKGRSLTVDFCVPANQEALVREIELANQRKDKLNLPHSNGQKVKPKRKAPPPPPPNVKVRGPQTDKVQEAEYNDIDDNKDRPLSVGDYVEIPEEFLDASFQNNISESDTLQRSGKSPSPPELPPRNLNTGTPVNSPQLSMKSLNPSITTTTTGYSSFRERPMSDISQNSSLSSQESPLQDELSSTDSEADDEDDRTARKKAKKIFNIVKEIASSEHVFVDVLRLLNVDFRLHISKATERAGRAIIPSEILNRILKFLPQLQNFNEDLLHDLEERVANWDTCKKVADIFIRKGPFLKMYTVYITDFEETNRVYDDALKRIPTFLQCVKEFEMSPRCASLGIRHYLLKPIQRIPQYKLLLQDYLKHLSPDSEDYENTCNALRIVSEVADHANKSMRQGDQVQKMLEIQRSLDGHFEVIKPGRILIKEGELMKLSRKEMQPRMFFLFNDVLLYTTPTPTGGYRLNNVLTLVGMKVTLPASEEYNTEFNVVSVHRSFTVEASSVAERDEWVKVLTEAIEDNTQRRNTFETVKAGNQSFYDKDFVLGSKAPIWIPDARVTMCMLCTCEFSVAWRRHHCRSCGRVVCASCSDNKAPLEYLRNKPARVCNECYHKLKTEFEDKVNTGTVTDDMTEDTDGSFLSLSSLKERFQQIRRSARFASKVKRPTRYIEVRANDLACSMSGNLKVMKGKKWKKYWFLLKDKVLYKYKASEDVAAIDTMPVIGYDVVRFTESYDGIAANLVFQLSHKNQTPLVFQTDNTSLTDRWVKAMEDAAKG